MVYTHTYLVFLISRPLRLCFLSSVLSAFVSVCTWSPTVVDTASAFSVTFWTVAFSGFFSIDSVGGTSGSLDVGSDASATAAAVTAASPTALSLFSYLEKKNNSNKYPKIILLEAIHNLNGLGAAQTAIGHTILVVLLISVDSVTVSLSLTVVSASSSFMSDSASPSSLSSSRVDSSTFVLFEPISVVSSVLFSVLSNVAFDWSNGICESEVETQAMIKSSNDGVHNRACTSYELGAGSCPCTANSIWSMAALKLGLFIELLVASFAFDFIYSEISFPFIFALDNGHPLLTHARKNDRE